MSLRAADYEVRPAPPSAAKRFVADHHYSKGSSHTCVYAHGLYARGTNDPDALLGAALWLPPTRRAAESVNRDDWRRVLALSRLAVHPDLPTNAASFLMGRSIRVIRAERRFSSLVTYADEFMGHLGAIYLATNWVFVGTSRPIPRWEDTAGRQVATLATRSRTSAEMAALGHRMVGRFRKRKFVMHFDPARAFLARIILSPLALALVA